MTTYQLKRRAILLWGNTPSARKWLVARLKVNAGTWKFPIGEKYLDVGIPEFLRKLPYGPPIEVIDTPYDLRMKGQQIIQGLFRGRR